MADQERVEAELGDPIDVTGTIQPNAMHVAMNVNGILFDVTIPDDKVDDLELSVQIFPQAFLAILEEGADRG